jgi:hypothetical protein
VVNLTSAPKEIDISEIRESLGAIMASFVYVYDPYAAIKEIDITMSFETAMLDVLGRWEEFRWGKEGIWVQLPPERHKGDNALIDTKPSERMVSVRKRVRNYKELFAVFRAWWESSVESWNSQTGNWKDSIIICSNLRAHLMRIALKEQLVSLSSSMYTIQLKGAERVEDSFFADDHETDASKAKHKKE